MIKHPRSAAESPRSWGGFDLPAKQARIAVLDKESSAPGFWDDNRTAQKKLIEVAGLRDEVDSWHEVEQGAESLRELAEMAIEESDDSIEASLQEDLSKLLEKFGRLEFALQLSGEYDERSAIILDDLVVHFPLRAFTACPPSMNSIPPSSCGTTCA